MIYIIKDANGDVDQAFVVDGELAREEEKSLSKRLNEIGFYLDSSRAYGGKNQLVQRIEKLEKEF